MTMTSTMKSCISNKRFAHELRHWNYIGGSPQFTKDQHSAAPLCNAPEMRKWNLDQNLDKYSKAEFAAGANICAYEMRMWNAQHNPEKFTKAEHAHACLTTYNPAFEMKCWNDQASPTMELYSEDEIQTAK